jgi:ankyrin repeat protein
VNHTGETALHRAARNASEDVVRILIQRGADVTIKNNVGETAADAARHEGHEIIANMLDK